MILRSRVRQANVFDSKHLDGLLNGRLDNWALSFPTLGHFFCGFIETSIKDHSGSRYTICRATPIYTTLSVVK